jgi:hypothetical protein
MTPPTPKGIVEALAEVSARRFDGALWQVSDKQVIAETFAPVEKLIEAVDFAYVRALQNQDQDSELINKLFDAKQSIEAAARGAANGKA